MIFFLLALLPIAVWGIQWYFNREVVWKEAAVGVGAALLVASIFTGIEAAGFMLPSELETRSAPVAYAQFQPRWKEYYEEAIYRTETYPCGTSKNPQTCTRTVFSHWESRRRWHKERWWVVSELGTFYVNQSRYNEICQKHGDIKAVPGDRRTGEHASRMIEGDPNDYRSVNATGYIYPITDNTKFTNRLLKSKTSLYNFEPVPAEQTKGLFEWPENQNRFDTDRLLGSAQYTWDRREWDQMNARLGPDKKVNLIAIGFPASTDLETGTLQERYWRGGRKNDLVLTYGGDPKNPNWAYVFGWTERQAVKRLLENRLLEGTATIDEISRLVREEYELFPFEERFEHVQVQTPWWYYLIYALVVLTSQGVVHFYFSTNQETKDSNSTYQRRYQRRYLYPRR